MKNIFLYTYLLLVATTSYSQPNWPVNTNTGANMTVLVSGGDLNEGDYFGLFFTDSNGDLVCGGKAMWPSSFPFTMTIYGDDSFESGKQGFSEGESFSWKVWSSNTMSVLDEDANLFRIIHEENPLFTTVYQTNGFANIRLEAILPITFFDFSLAEKEGNVELNWEIAATDELGEFQVLSSTNGIDFEVVAMLPQVSSKTQYRFVDEQAKSGRTYYKISHIDPAGKYSFSAIRTVKILSKVTAYSVYPNPFGHSLYLEAKEAITHFRLVNAWGQVVLAGPYVAKEIDTSGLPVGTYFMVPMGEGGRMKEPVMVQKL